MDLIPPPIPMPDMTQPAPPSDPAPPSTRCGNCAKEPATSKCMRCLKVVYCDGVCQKADWKFHKRVCEPPKAKKEEPPAHSSQDSPPTGGSEKSSGSGGGGVSSESENLVKSASSATAMKSSSKNTEIINDDDLDADELEALAAVRKTGYRVVRKEILSFSFF